MDFLTITSIGGNTRSFRKDRIEIIEKRICFTKEELKAIPELNGKESCAIIKLIGSEVPFYCQDSYESIMARMTAE